jgi:cardiolipin synthase
VSALGEADALLAPFEGGHRVALMRGGDELFPAMVRAIDQARTEVWLATYIFNDDPSGRLVVQALRDAAGRGVQVRLVVDGFGSNGRIAELRRQLQGSLVGFEVFRSLERWWAWSHPSQLRRMHQKLCAVDGLLAFVGGINVVDDRFDVQHGWTEEPRLDFAVQVEGQVAAEVQRLVHALWTRAHVGRGWREEVALLVQSPEPVQRVVQLLRDMRANAPQVPRPAGERRRRLRDWLRGDGADSPQEAAGFARVAGTPARVALVVRDNVTHRRAIERAYVEAIGQARERIDIACSYFYPGRAFRRALRRAAARGVRIRLLMQGKIDYRLAGLAARVLYDEMLSHGIRIYEYTPAYLHAKVAVVDGQWATVGSSNIDPLSLLLNLEANVVVLDEAFAADLGDRLEQAFAVSQEVTAPPVRPGLRGWLMRGFVAWVANVYLRAAGITGRY